MIDIYDSGVEIDNTDLFLEQVQIVAILMSINYSTSYSNTSDPNFIGTLNSVGSGVKSSSDDLYKQKSKLCYVFYIIYFEWERAKTKFPHSLKKSYSLTHLRLLKEKA